MTGTYKVGAATGYGARAYARYVIESALLQENVAAAAYYAGDVWARDVPEPAAELRPDLSPAFAARLGIDPSRPLTLTEIGNLMNNLRTDGNEIDGKKRHSPHQSVASVFGLNPKELPSVVEIENVLAGKRVDGQAPRAETGNGPPLADHVIASSLRQFKAAIGIPTTRDATAVEIANTANGRIDLHEYRKKISATAPAVGFVDLTFSADKSVSVAWALAPSEIERQIILSAAQEATSDAMAYVESVLGVARRGAGGRGELEPAEMAWVGFQHYTSRPAVDVVRTNAYGEVFTDTRAVPMETADPNLHQHRIALSSMLTESGRIGSIDISRIDGETKVFGAVFHAGIATRLREHGVDVVLGPHGEARIVGIPDWARKLFSRRHEQTEESAKAWAAEQGKDWDSLDGEERITLLNAGAAATRQSKLKRQADEGRGDLAVWQQDAAMAGYNHRSVLRPDRAAPVLTNEQRIQIARNASLPLLDAAYQKDAVLPEGKVREIAARGLIASGLGARAADDIEAVIQTYRDQGIAVKGKPTKLVWGVEFGADGRSRTVVSTGHNISQEKELVWLAQTLAADKSGGLTTEQIDQAAERFLARNPRIDPNGAQWKSQLDMAHALGSGPRLGLAIGVGGSGKTSSVVATLVDAWHMEGKKVVAMTVPWRATQPLRDAGVDDAMAVEAFVKRVAAGKYTVDQNTVIIADEVSMISVPHQNSLLSIAKDFGARIVEIGDPRQCAAVETPAIDLMCKAIGDDYIPKILTSIRQQTQRGRDIAALFRNGRAEEGIAAMREDGDVTLVAGGNDATIQRTVASWRNKITANAANPDYSLVVMTATNERAFDISQAIRVNRMLEEEIGHDEVTVQAKIGPQGKVVDLPLAVGDMVRPFHRLFDADVPGRTKHLASNGDIVEVRELLSDGLRISNAKGQEGRVTWSQFKPFRAPKNDPIVLTYGYASSIDSVQSLTRSEALLSLPDGSQQVNGNKAYTALSRHERSVEIIVSDAAERQQIQRREMLGNSSVPREADVIANIAANLSRFQKTRYGSEMREQERGTGQVAAGEASWLHMPPAEGTTEQAASSPDTAVAPGVAVGPHPNEIPSPPAAVRQDIEEIPEWATEALPEAPIEAKSENAPDLPPVEIEFTAMAVVAGWGDYAAAVDHLMDRWDQSNPLPSKDEWRKAADELMVWNETAKHWDWTGPDPIQQWEEQRMDVEMRVMTQLDSALDKLEALPPEAQERLFAQIDGMLERMEALPDKEAERTMPTVTQAERDAARLASSSSVTKDIYSGYNQSREQEMERE